MTRENEIRNQRAEFVSSTRICAIILLSAFCLLHSVGCGDVSRGRYNQASLKMVVQPVFSGAAMNRAFMPLFGYLSSETGYEVQYLSSLTFDGLGATIESSGAALVLCDPVTLLTLRRTHQARVLAAGDGAALAPGLIIVNSAAGILDCAQLKGRGIAIISQQSAQGYVSQALFLQARGIVLPRDARLSSCGTMEEVVAAVRSGRAAAGFVSPQALAGSRTADVTVLCQTTAVPNWVCATLDGGSTESDAKVAAALLRLSPANAEQGKILQQLGYSRFGEVPAVSLTELERQVRSLKVPY